MQFVRWVGAEANDLPIYEGLPNLAYFYTYFEVKVMESQHLSTLNFVLKATPARWWGTHKESISEWKQCRILMKIIFGEEISYAHRKYTGLKNSFEHIEYSCVTWEACPQ